MTAAQPLLGCFNAPASVVRTEVLVWGLFYRTCLDISGILVLLMHVFCRDHRPVRRYTRNQSNEALMSSSKYLPNSASIPCALKAASYRPAVSGAPCVGCSWSGGWHLFFAQTAHFFPRPHRSSTAPCRRMLHESDRYHRRV